MLQKEVLRRKFMAIQTFLKREGKYQINNLTYHLKELEKEEQNLKSAEGRKQKSERKSIKERFKKQ